VLGKGAIEARGRLIEVPCCPVETVQAAPAALIDATADDYAVGDLTVLYLSYQGEPVLARGLAEEGLDIGVHVYGTRQNDDTLRVFCYFFAHLYGGL
jgi:hypothetical protein